MLDCPTVGIEDLLQLSWERMFRRQGVINTKDWNIEIFRPLSQIHLLETEFTSEASIARCPVFNRTVWYFNYLSGIKMRDIWQPYLRHFHKPSLHLTK